MFSEFHLEALNHISYHFNWLRVMEYIFNDLKEVIQIERIGTLFYFEYDKNYKFHGEHHDFWEMVYCDKGEITIVADDTEITLLKGQIIFHKPGEFHNIMANNKVAPNVMNISFECGSKAMDNFKNKILTLNNKERNLLIQIFIEANTIFDPIIDESVAYLKPKEEQPIGGAQLIKINLEMLLLQLLRRELQQTQKGTVSKETTIVNNDALFNTVVSYMQDNLSRKITTDDICRDTAISRSSLQLLFRKKTKMGVIEYFDKIKIDVAKEMIRDGKQNFSQIAESLGFKSLHYFSRKFKVKTKMSPSEYSSSVKSRISVQEYPPNSNQESPI